jgi:putative transposase
VRYAFIARHRDELPVRLMCKWLRVSPAGFYASLGRPVSRRAQLDQRLRVEIRAVHAASARRYGAPKVHDELRRDHGIVCGHNRVARLMREDGLRAKRSQRYRVTTQSDHRYPRPANVLDRRFAPSLWERDRAWAADITYLETREGWLYLAVILDLSSRRVVGWCADERLDQSLALRALDMALLRRQPKAGLIHHSDQGFHYATNAYQDRLAAHGVINSMSRRGNCWDNAVVESFFATLKTELAHDAHWPTRPVAQRALADYIEDWYNERRRHASLGNKTPAQFERELGNRSYVA